MNTRHLIIINRISILYRKWLIYLREELKPYDFEASEIPYVLTLFQHGEEGILQDDMIKRLAMAKSGTTKALLQLESKGFIYRKESPDNQVYKLVYPTQKLYEYKDIVYAIVNNWYDIIKQDFSEEELLLFKLFLERAKTNAYDKRN